MADPANIVAPDYLAMFAPQPNPEEVALARAAALKRTRDVEGLRSIGLLGSILGGNAAPMGQMAAAQAKQLEEQGAELASADARQREHALSRAMAAANQERLEFDRQYRRANPTQFYVQGQNGLVGMDTRGPGAGIPKPVYEPGPQAAAPPIDTSTPIREPAGPLPPPAQPQPFLKDKPVDEKVLRDLQAADQEAASVKKLGSTFKDEYAASGFMGGLTGPLKVAMAQKAGADAPKMGEKSVLQSLLGPQFSREAANWWAEFERRVQMGARHELFGSAFTPSEQAIWERAQTINPKSAPEDIKRAWEEMEQVILSKPAQIRAQLKGQHYNPVPATEAPPAQPAVQAPSGGGWSDAKEKRLQELRQKQNGAQK